jgi:hypothetical protein
MTDTNKYSSHMGPEGNGDNANIVDEQQIKEAEEILVSPHHKIPLLNEKENEVDKMLSTQSLSIIFQDLNEAEIKKMTQQQKEKLPEIREDDWNYSKRGEVSNINVKDSKIKDKSLHHSVSNIKDQELSNKDNNLRDIKAIGLRSSSKIKLQLDVIGNIGNLSKNNSVVSHSARSDMKVKINQRDANVITHDIHKDKLFSQEDGLDKEYDSRIEGGYGNKEWDFHASKPGMDRSEFYNPDAVNDSFDNSKKGLPKIPNNHEDGKGEHHVDPKLNENSSGPLKNDDNKVLNIDETPNDKNTHQNNNQGRNEVNVKQTFMREYEVNKAAYEREYDYRMSHPQRNKENTLCGQGDASSDDINNDYPDQVYNIKKEAQDKNYTNNSFGLKNTFKNDESKENEDKAPSNKQQLKENHSYNSIATSNNDNTNSIPRDRSERSFIKHRLNGKSKVLENMPFKPMQFISHYATISDQLRMACTSKTMLGKVKEQEDVWNIKV